MKESELKLIIENHSEWLKDNTKGKRAILCRQDLSGANLSGIDLSKSDLSEANLNSVNLIESNLSNAILSYSNVYNAALLLANLSGAVLTAANIFNCDLQGAKLIKTELFRTNFYNSSLKSVDFSKASIYETNFGLCNLTKSNFTDSNIIHPTFHNSYISDANFGVQDQKMMEYLNIIPPGDIVGWEKCRNNKIVKLKIPAKAKRFNSTSRKCRAEYAIVLQIDMDGTTCDHAISKHDPDLVYIKRRKVVPLHGLDPDWKNECSGGIHFFLTREEAECSGGIHFFLTREEAENYKQ